MPPSARSLADDIRARTDVQLAELLRARPDLARPAPSDLTALAARASTRASVHQALAGLDRGLLDVLEGALAASDSTGSRPVSASEIARAVGIRTAGEIRGQIETLWSRAVLWRSTDGLRAVRAVLELLGPTPNGLGPRASELYGLAPAVAAAKPAALRAALSRAPEAASAVLDSLAWGPAIGVLGTSPAAREGARWLVEAGLVAPMSRDRIALPREVALLLRGGQVHRATQLHPPPVDGPQLEEAVVGHAAGGAAIELVGLAEELALRWGSDPPRVLRSGGLAVRDVDRLARALDLEPARAGWLVEVCRAAGLVEDDGGVRPQWAPTPEFDEWLGSGPAARWERLARAWVTMTPAPHLIGSRVPTGTSAVVALSAGTQWPPIVRLRRDVLGELAALPVGVAASAESLVERLHWRRPLRTISATADLVATVLREAEWVGFAARGALSRAGHHAFGGQDGAGPSGAGGAGPIGSKAARPGGPDRSNPAPEPSWAADMAGDLPPTVDHILLQADLTALAPGPLEPDLAALMRTVAKVESRGTATVFRIDHASIRHALDTGRSADELLTALAAASRTPVPQPLDYLIRDIARVHGRTRIGGATAYIRSDDEATLRAMVSHRALAPLRLRLLAPSVAVSQAEPATVLELLREAGFTPAQETLDGTIVLQTPHAVRAPARRRPAPMPVSGLDPAAAATLVRQLREAEGSANTLRERGGDPRTGLPPTSDPLVVLAALREATAEGRGVWIGYADQNGTASPIFLYPTKIEGGRAWGAVPPSQQDRGFLLHRITGVIAS